MGLCVYTCMLQLTASSAVSVEKLTAKEEGNCQVGVQPITLGCELGDLECEICIEPECHSFSEITDYEETEDEVRCVHGSIHRDFIVAGGGGGGGI